MAIPTLSSTARAELNNDVDTIAGNYHPGGSRRLNLSGMIFTSFDNLTRMPVSPKIATDNGLRFTTERFSTFAAGEVCSKSLSRLEESLVAGVDAAPKAVRVAKLHSFHERGRSAPSGDRENANDGELRKNGYSRMRYVGGRTVATMWHSEPNMNGMGH
ncbi:hypothetical protein ACHAW6_004338 [Cyclotella cf. meneghiniana]